MANVIEIIIKANNKASGALTDLKSGLDMITRYGKQAADVILDLAAAGAEYERSAATFERVAGGAQNAATMLDALKVATMGTKSEVELMNSAASLLTLGLADSAGEMGVIMSSVEALGARFGGTMQIFQLMMSNNSLMRIDSFGIGVGEATARINKFKAAGMDADTAFDTAVLELMGEKFVALGGAVEDNVTSMLQLKAAAADLKAEMGLLLAGPAGDAIRWLTDLTTGTREQLQAQQAFNEEFPETRGNFLGGALDVALWNEEQKKAIAHQDAMNSALGTTVPTWEEASGILEEVAQKTFIVSDAMRDSAGNVINSAVAFDQYAKATADALPPLAAVAESMERVNRLKGVMGASIGEGLETAKQKLGDLRGEAAQLEGKISDLEGKSYLTGAQQEELGSLRGKLGDIRGEIGGVIEDAKKMAGAFVLSALESQIAADGLWTQAEADLFASTGRQLGMFDEVAAGMISMTATAVEQVNSGALDATEATNLIISGTEAAVEKFTTLGTVGGGAMEGIASKTGGAIAKLIDVGNQAVIAQAKIDAMHGKDLDINVKFNIPDIPKIQGAAGAIRMASGFDGVFNRPTMAIFGESGPEYVRAVPKSEWNDNTTNTRGGDTFIINNNAQAAMVMEQRKRNMGLAGRF